MNNECAQNVINLEKVTPQDAKGLLKIFNSKEQIEFLKQVASDDINILSQLKVDETSTEIAKEVDEMITPMRDEVRQSATNFARSVIRGYLLKKKLKEAHKEIMELKESCKFRESLIEGLNKDLESLNRRYIVKEDVQKKLEDTNIKLNEKLSKLKTLTTTKFKGTGKNTSCSGIILHRIKRILKG